MPKSIGTVLAHNLAAAMERQGLSANALAKRSGVAQTHLSKVLRGEAELSTGKLAEVAGGLGLHPWELLVDSEAVRERAIRRVLQPDAPQDQPRRASRKA
jgi:transcriptional regulator with XRE-family HTH domain